MSFVQNFVVILFCCSSHVKNVFIGNICSALAVHGWCNEEPDDRCGRRVDRQRPTKMAELCGRKHSFLHQHPSAAAPTVLQDGPHGQQERPDVIQGGEIPDESFFFINTL